MFYTYVIYSTSKKYIYVGITSNFERRFSEHQKGENKTTKPYRPFDVLLVEEFSTRIEARQREKHLKSGIGKEYLKMLLLEKERKAVS